MCRELLSSVSPNIISNTFITITINLTVFYSIKGLKRDATQLKPFLNTFNVSPKFFLPKVCRHLKKVEKHCSTASFYVMPFENKFAVHVSRQSVICSVAEIESQSFGLSHPIKS